MNTANNPYIATFIVNRCNIVIMEKSSSSEERKFEVQVDGILLGEINLLIFYVPGIAISDSHVALWGGTRIYIGSLAGHELNQYLLDDEIHSVYPMGNQWCLVCETSVVIWEPSTGVQMRYEHNEVLMSNWWSDDLLVVEDFQGRRLVFQPLKIESCLIPQITSGCD
jgi:hypothetical protein